MSDPFWILKPPYTVFDFGMVVLFLAVAYTYTGKAYVCFQGWVYRADEPKRYWSEVAMSYLVGIVLIGLFMVHMF